MIARHRSHRGRWIAAAAAGLLMTAAIPYAAVRYVEGDRVHDDDDAFASRLGPRTLSAPPGVRLPESTSGAPFDERPFDAAPTFRALIEGAGKAGVERSEAAPPWWAGSVVTISRTMARFDAADLTVPVPPDAQLGFESRFKRESRKDLFVVPLGQSLDSARWFWKTFASATGRDPDVRWATLLVDRDVPYRILKEFFYTSRQTWTEGFHLGVSRGGRLATIDLLPVPFGAPEWEASLPTQPSISLHVGIAGDGFLVTAFGAQLGQGCLGPGRGATIPVRTTDGKTEYDYAALTRCVTRLKHQVAEASDERAVDINTGDEIPYHVLVSALDAVRRGEDGQELFPDVSGDDFGRAPFFRFRGGAE